MLFLTLVTVVTVIRLWLNQRQIRAVQQHREAVPAAFRDAISLAAHQKAADYTCAKARLARWEILFDALLVLGWTIGGGLQRLSDLVGGLGLPSLADGVVLILLFGLISSLLSAPFSLYRQFVIEARFGFNRTTIATLIADTLKGLALTLILATPLLYVILWLLEAAGTYWWFYAWLAFFGFSILISWAYPTLIAPLFNRFTPLEDKSLKAAIEQLLDHAGFTSKGIFVMDGSRRSSHGNAYFTGLGKNKRIVFFDTLLEGLDREQIIAVLAHELGHFKHHHVLKGLLLSAFTSLVGFALLAWLLPQTAFYQALGVATPSPATGLILFSIVIPLVMFFVSPLFAWLSRQHEFEADAYAASQANAKALITALVTMYKDNASTLTPDRLHSLFYNSHPPAAIRIARLEALQRRTVGQSTDRQATAA